MKLSIIVVNYNTKKVLQNCVNSIRKYPPKCKFEAIIVDNGSTDGSVEYLKSLKNKHFKAIFNTQNLGFSKANNIGIKKSKGKFKLLLNSDTLVTKHALDKLVNFAQENKNIGVIGAKLLNKDKTIQPSVFRLPTVARNIKQYWLGQGKVLDKYAPKTEKPTEVEAVVGAAMLITPKALKKAGLLNEKYFMFYEDLDYCRKVRKKGLKAIYHPNAKIIHLHGESGKSLNSKQNQWKRLIPSSKAYHGTITHYIIFFIQWTSQKLRPIFSKK